MCTEFIKRTTCMKGNKEEAEEVWESHQTVMQVWPCVRRGKEVWMEVSAEPFVSPSVKADCQVLPISQKWVCICIPTSLNYWWEAAHGRHSLSANAGMNFREQQLGPLVNFAPCSRRQPSHGQNIWVLDDEKDLTVRRGEGYYKERCEGA